MSYASRDYSQYDLARPDTLYQYKKPADHFYTPSRYFVDDQVMLQLHMVVDLLQDQES